MEHLKATKSDRGFNHMPAIWLRATAPKNLSDHDGDWEDTPIHLTVENARKLADQLNWLCNNHYQLRYLEDAEITE
jgi:hypothetical protein